MALKTAKYFLSASISTSLLFGSNSLAQDLKTPAQLDAIYLCTNIQEESLRLTCFDKTVAEFQTAKAAGEIITVSKTEIEGVKKDGFGFNLPSLSGLGKIFKSDDKSEKDDSKRVVLTIDRTKRYDRTRTRFYFTNGQIWEQISEEKIYIPKVKDESFNTAVIKKAAFGSFLMRVNGKGSSIRVRRVQ